MCLLYEPDRDKRSVLLMRSVTPGEKKWGMSDEEIGKAARRLGGWTDQVYRFGSKFIHLSSQHDYAVRDPFQLLPLSERTNMVKYLNDYHEAGLTPESTFLDIVAYVPKVFDKISSNLELNLNALENS
jgi:hypothetical protein